MAKTPPSERARLFVALDPPEEARLAIANWRDELLAGRPGLRPVKPEALHVTLAFLGWQEEAAAEAIAAAAFGSVEGIDAPLLTPLQIRSVPPRRPRLYALDLEDRDKRCERVQAAVAGALEQAGLYQPEKRPFWPHITLARVKRGARAAEPPHLPGPPREPFAATELTLYRSTLRPEGAVYEPLARLPLLFESL